ncbi:DEAD/DEAH box helicase [Actinocrispum wychmicini]|uniref:SNF2 family DNA or RNA helicase n=1 Tax=Actinocrispum wychmicini TaxID=1213861 RepID=A0A4V2S4M4_9PSEU|nr:DEAD/DEAH box helicase [Actinocrispum wychmicini]TCO48870.1 SNF2 family DNA or RNA helicase [Actinocrispum wychmicini]
MLVVHSVWSSDGRVRVWAEDATLPATVGGSGRPPKRPRPHPFSASTVTLRKIVSAGAEGELGLLLPSSARGPFAAPELVRPEAGKVTAPRLLPWTVSTMDLTPAEAVPALADGVAETVGGSWRWLAAVARFGTSLVDRGQVLPGLVGAEARWMPQVVGADADHSAALLRAMPAVVRAELPEGRAKAEVYDEVLLALTDAVARGRVGPYDGGGWLRALTVEDAHVDGDLTALEGALRAWHESAAPPVGPLRTCFRLVLPEDEDPDWRVEFSLQATEDPSLAVSAGDVWRGSGSAKLLARHAEHPAEVLLAGLGRASRVYPELDAALRVTAPDSLRTDPEGAYRFLRQSANALTLAGFGVQLPAALQRGTSLGLKLKAGSATEPGAGAVVSGGMGLDQILSYRWELAVGDSELTADEIKELAAAKAPLVRLRGQWVELDNARLRRALEFLEQNGEGEMTARDVLQADSALAAIGLDIPVTDVVADGWLGDVLTGKMAERLTPVSTPDGFGATLRPYQERGLAWLSFLSRLGLGACLADDMGLGKTVQLLALIAAEGSRPNLLVCPMSVVGNWQREAARFTPSLRVYVHHGAGRVAGEELADAVSEADLVITTYGVVAREPAALADLGWHRVVLDEAQNIKNSASKQARAVRSVPAAHRVALTGTPVENRLAELWSVMEFANPGLLGPASAFRTKFAVPIERDKDPAVTAALRRRTQPFVLRRVKTDKAIISDLPDKIEMKEVCQLTAEQGSLYQAVVTDMMDRIAASEGMERRGLVLATLSRLKQVCNHPAHLLKDGSRMPGRSGKLARLEEILEVALSEGDRALCFTQFAEFGEMLRAHLTARFERPVLFLHGGVTKSQRDAMVERFQSDDGPPIFVLSLKAGGVGLNLTAASHVVHVDRWWNPAVEDQATDRAFRIGQRRNVQVRKFVCAGTVEDRIDEMIERKKALAELVVGTGEDWLTELSTDALREMFELSPNAVGEAA